MEQARILIVSDDPEFVNSLVQSWQRLQYVPEFTVSGVKDRRRVCRERGGADRWPGGAEHLPVRRVVLAIAGYCETSRCRMFVMRRGEWCRFGVAQVGRIMRRRWRRKPCSVWKPRRKW